LVGLDSKPSRVYYQVIPARFLLCPNIPSRLIGAFDYRTMITINKQTIWRNLLKNYFENKCCYCESTNNLHLHHKLPLSLGGSNTLGNLELVCRNCHLKLHHQINKIFRNGGICENCGKRFEMCGGGQRYCSKECRMVTRKHINKFKGKNIKRKCEFCGREYVVQISTQKYCSKWCSHMKERGTNKLKRAYRATK